MQETIFSRAPFRISFAGGGTDLPEYYEKYEGVVLSTAIDKYCYTILRQSLDDSFHLKSAIDGIVWECFQGIPKIYTEDRLAIQKSALATCYEGKQALDIFTTSEIPSGTGLGSSSALAVSVLQALLTSSNVPYSKYDLAEAACRLEIDVLRSPIGKQDQYASAFGGLNLIWFYRNETLVEPMQIAPERLRLLEDNLLLFYVGGTRKASEILREQKQATQSNMQTLDHLHQLKQLALDMANSLRRGQMNEFGSMLHHAWELKKGLSDKISNPHIDEIYQLTLKLGALGGKLAGAGGAGFLMLYVPQTSQPKIKDKLEAFGVREMPFSFDFEGACLLKSGWSIIRSNQR